MTLVLNRRAALGSALAFGAVGMLPGLAFAAAPTARRFVFIIQRGAADGLSIVAPTGDPALAGLRGGLTEPGGTRLDAMFTLHPALAGIAPLFARGQARAFHAVASAYRDRSHFDGQNVLESGGALPYALKTGWMGRLLGLLPAAQTSALALAPAVPLALRGALPVATYAPNALPAASDDLLRRVTMLYEPDAQLGPLWTEALKTKALTGDIGGNNGRNGAQLGALAATLMTPADDARLMMIETGGWDTHTAQKQRLAAQLRGLDALIGGLKTGLGPAWSETLVLVATEFGRTAAVNGTGGTDHGTASAALLLGGALAAGPPVVAQWPGLSAAELYDGRDLKPTQGPGDIVSAALAHHYALPSERLAGLFA